MLCFADGLVRNLNSQANRTHLLASCYGSAKLRQMCGEIAFGASDFAAEI